LPQDDKDNITDNFYIIDFHCNIGEVHPLTMLKNRQTAKIQGCSILVITSYIHSLVFETNLLDIGLMQV
jgi:hypothetical protein